MKTWSVKLGLVALHSLAHSVMVALLATSTIVFSVPASSAVDLTAFCADRPNLGVDRFQALQALLKSYMRAPASNRLSDDIVSGALLRLAKACIEGRVPKDEANQKAVLNTIFRDSRVDEHRANKRLVLKELDELESLGSRINHVNIADVEKEILIKSSPLQQKIVRMRYEDRTMQEIADQLSVSVGTVHKELAAIKKLGKEEFDLSGRVEAKIAAAIKSWKEAKLSGPALVLGIATTAMAFTTPETHAADLDILSWKVPGRAKDYSELDKGLGDIDDALSNLSDPNQ